MNNNSLLVTIEKEGEEEDIRANNISKSSSGTEATIVFTSNQRVFFLYGWEIKSAFISSLDDAAEYNIKRLEAMQKEAWDETHSQSHPSEAVQA